MRPNLPYQSSQKMAKKLLMRERGSDSLALLSYDSGLRLSKEPISLRLYRSLGEASRFMLICWKLEMIGLVVEERLKLCFGNASPLLDNSTENARF